MQQSPYRLCPWYFTLSDYQWSVLQGWLRDQWRRVRGKSKDLAKFDDVAARAKARHRLPVRREYVPVDAIVGSVGHSHNFTRDFFPRPTANRERWTAHYTAASAGVDLPPVELYQIGQMYFVANGNHRISVARAHGFGMVVADVITFESASPPTVAGVRDSLSGVKADPKAVDAARHAQTRNPVFE